MYPAPVPSRRTSGLLLYLALLLTLPVPYYLGAVEVAPVARLLFLSGLVLGVVATEGVAGYQGAFAGLAAVQSLLWPLLLLALARILVRVLERGVPARWRAGTLGLALLALGIVGLLPIYSTELSSQGASSSLVQLLD